MKIAIITYHASNNYGAALQCLALQRQLTQLGVTAEVLDYQPRKPDYLPFWKGWGIRKGLFLKNLPKRLIKIKYGTKSEESFEKFRIQYFNRSKYCSNKKEVASLANQYDAFIAGSDQVWYFARESVYFLDWGAPYAGKRISYAPCCGMINQPELNREDLKKWILQIDHLSTRNQFSYDLIHDLTGLTPKIVADPTLLIDLSDVAQKVTLPFSDYILMYTLGEEINGGHLSVIESIRKKVGNLPVVAVVPASHKPHLAPWADHVIYTAGPSEWLWLIQNATFVYTDSFHAVLFSINNNRPFLTYYAEEWRAPRLVDLAKRYQIQERVVGSSKEASEKLSHPFDLSATKKLILSHVEQSKSFLQSTLK